MKNSKKPLIHLFVVSWVGLHCQQANAASLNGVQVRAVISKAALYGDVADQYLDAADRLKNSNDERTSTRQLDYKERQCEVLADLLILGGDSVEDSLQEDPGLDSQDTKQLALYASSLNSYVKAAFELIARDEFSWKYLWNLNCSGKYNSFHFFELSEPEPYRITVSADSSALNVIGDIQPDLFERVAEALQDNKGLKSVELASRGGNIGVAMKIGRLVRSRVLDTTLTSDCYSSCTLIFIAGTRRIVPAPYYSLGFHRITQFDRNVDDSDPDYLAVKKYANDMIGAGDQFVRYWRSGSGEYFFRPDRNALCGSKIATDVEAVCTHK